MTTEQIEALHLGIAPINDRTILLIESGFNWVLDNTSLNFDYNNNNDLATLPPNVKLFVVKYVDIMSMTAGVSSESIEGLSQSFDTSDKGALLWQFANELLSKWLKSQIHFVTASKKW